MTCPQCGSDKMMRSDYDRSDYASGYSDVGVEYLCLTCDAISTEQEMDAANKEAE